MPEIRLTPTSYIVLGLLAANGPATPYELKRQHAAGIGNFWTLNHAQIYAEPARLATAGYVTEQRERGGRRRKTYELTDTGRRALAAWLSDPVTGFTELRDPGLLKLWLGADRRKLARAQAQLHRERLAEYEALAQTDTSAWSAAARLTLESGIGHEREWVRFWERAGGRGRPAR